MEPVSARFKKFEPVHRVSGKIFFETGLQTGLSEQGHSPNGGHGVLVWWGNFWLESAISAEASGHLSSTLPGGQLGEL